MKILLDLGDLDTNADDDEVLSIIRSVVMDSHELESGNCFTLHRCLLRSWNPHLQRSQPARSSRGSNSRQSEMTQLAIWHAM